jgi:acetyltransferase-like isoleucine patch superfamily enzyme
MTRKPLLRRIVNRVLSHLAQRLPGATTLRPRLHRWRGVRIHGRVFIGDQVYLENEYPECIEIDDGAQISVRSILIAHVRGPGRIVIAKDALVGPGCVITAAPGRTVVIGEGAVISALTPVTRSVVRGTLYSGPRPTVVARVGTPLTLETTYDDFMAGLRRLDERERS